MDRTVYENFTLLNKRGKYLQRLLLFLSDEELKKITPSPSSKTIKSLKERTMRYSLILSVELN